MRRREFITLLAAMACPFAARAQARAKRVAILGPAEQPRFSEVSGGLKRGLRERGFADADLDVIEFMVARGDQAATRSNVETALRQHVTVLFVIGSELARVARQVSADLPIVFITPGDPVAAGLVASLARPGGNTTAMTFEFPELSAKRLELLKALVPSARRVLALYDPSDRSPLQGLAAARNAAPKLGMTLVEREARSNAGIASAREALGEVDALLVIPGGATSAHYREIILAANLARRPSFVHSRMRDTVNALASYGASDVRIAQEAARLVEKILKGENAGDLPVERPTKFQFVINLKTAKVLGLEIPPTPLAFADEVIE